MIANTLTCAREMAGGATPLLGDCGRYCQNACCRADAEGKGGVFLFPGEEALYDNEPWAHIEDIQMLDYPAKILYCNGTCPRDARPLGCRIFPLTPDFSRGEIARVRFDYRARPICPLAKNGLRGLTPAFVKAVEAALRLIADDREGNAFLRRWAQLEEQYDFRL